MFDLIEGDFLKWMRDNQWQAQNGYLPKFHAAIGDTPYFLGSIVKRFGGANASPAKFGKDGAFKRASNGFMGRAWDSFEDVWHYQAWVTEWATLLLDFMYPGAVVAFFGGTRTYHRVAAGLEDAGWEVFDCLMYMYGCVDDETEVLTEKGWMRYHKNIARSRILCYNKDTHEFTWEYPSSVSHYQYDDTAYRIQSDSTDQLVSRNHRCLIERDGTLLFQFAEDAAQEPEIRVPILEVVQPLREAIPDVQPNSGATKQALPGVSGLSLPKKVQAARRTQVNVAHLRRMREAILSPELLVEDSQRPPLQPCVQRQSAWSGMGETRLQGLAVNDSCHEQKEGAIGQQKRCMERRSNLPKAEGQLRQSVDQIRPLPGAIQINVSQGWIRDGASFIGRPGGQSTIAQDRSGTSRQPRRNRQPYREFDVIRVQPRSQVVRTPWITRTDLARITPVHYVGVMWCPTVVPGAFVARRNGKMFITGNTGFPKSADVGKLIDKAAGEARETSGVKPGHEGFAGRTTTGHVNFAGGALEGFDRPWMHDAEARERYHMQTEPATAEGALWDGFKTYLKPSYEPIVLARAPRQGYGFAQLATKFQSGALNIDAARIPFAGDVDPRTFSGTWSQSNAGELYGGGWNGEERGTSLLGRYPANTILGCSCEGDVHDIHCPVSEMNRQSGMERRAGGNLNGKEPTEPTSGIVYNGNYGRHTWQSYDDNGGAARFFYTTKAATWEREAGLEDFEAKIVNDGREKDIDNAYQRGATLRKNTHATVKPIQLATWLAKLFLPPAFGQERRILIPFSGVGSEMIGAHLAGWDTIVGVEREAEYTAINRARTAWWGRFSSYDDAKNAYDARIAAEKQDDAGQLRMF